MTIQELFKAALPEKQDYEGRVTIYGTGGEINSNEGFYELYKIN